MSVALIFVVLGPFLAALLLARVAPLYRATALMSVVTVHTTLVAWLLREEHVSLELPGVAGLPLGGLRLDPAGAATLLVVDLVLAAVALRLPPWRAARPGPPDHHVEPLLLLLQGTVAIVALADDLRHLWLGLLLLVAAAAPLVAWRQHRRALEAAWRLIVPVSVGLMAMLLGIFMLTAAASLPTSSFASLAQPKVGAPEWWTAGTVLLAGGLAPLIGVAPWMGWRLKLSHDTPPPAAAVLNAALSGAGILALIRILEAVQGARELLAPLVMVGAFVSLGLGLAGLSAEDRALRLISWVSVAQVGVSLLLVAAGAHGPAIYQGISRDLLIAVLWLNLPAGGGRGPGRIRRPIAALALGLLAGLGSGATAMFVVISVVKSVSGVWVGGAALLLIGGVALTLLLRVLPRMLALAHAEPDPDAPVSALLLLLIAIVTGLWIPEGVQRALALWP